MNETIATQKEARLNIDFLYLDLNTCERCMATDDTLNEALAGLSGVFDTLGYTVDVNKIEIETQELAEYYEFVSSPTIRVNGVDICSELVESDCSDCGDLCGDAVDCRVFTYKGESYEQPPAALIMDGILRVMFGGERPKVEKYLLPANIENYFNKLNGLDPQDGSGCGCAGGDCC